MRIKWAVLRGALRNHRVTLWGIAVLADWILRDILRHILKENFRDILRDILRDIQRDCLRCVLGETS